jgi:hypothetical protein
MKSFTAGRANGKHGTAGQGGNVHVEHDTPQVVTLVATVRPALSKTAMTNPPLHRSQNDWPA